MGDTSDQLLQITRLLFGFYLWYSSAVCHPFNDFSSYEMHRNSGCKRASQLIQNPWMTSVPCAFPFFGFKGCLTRFCYLCLHFPDIKSPAEFV